jgi:LysR family transcriptional regulator, transcriptional activator of nhaA
MERLNYHHLYLFWTLSKVGTFTKTAEKLLISQSAVTAQIKNLEDTLGLILIDRTNKRKPVITEEGKSILDFANSIFETGEELLQWAKLGTPQKNQILKMGALSGLSRNLQFEFLKPILKQKNIKIEVTTGDQQKLIRLLNEHHLDLILSSHNVRSEGRINLYSNVLTTSPLVFVAARSKIIKGAELKDYLIKMPLCIPGQSFESRSEIEAYLDRYRTPKNIIAEIDDIALLRLFAVQSDSLVLVPEMGVRNEIKSGEVVVVAKPRGLEQKFYVISRQKRFPNPVVEALIGRMRASN